ncbi:hypothetical protein ACGFYQ_10835 [Streptomyces sp. NPDC048258]|uniref:hypothetical protein n=1 Tax=Streptomyces sp. NPDC048258 TaxID=3365527 RepID=UPI0037184FEB
MKRMNQYLWQMERLARATPGQGDSSEGWDRAYENYRIARQEYIDHARKSLGVTEANLTHSDLARSDLVQSPPTAPSPS